MDKQRKSSLTSFNLQTPEDTVNEEGVLSKIFDKVLHAVAGGGGGGYTSTSAEHGHGSERDPQQQRLPHSISANSSLSKHLTTASSSTTLSSPSTTTATTSKDNFPVLDTVAVPRSSRSTTTATTTTTVTVGSNQKLEPMPPTTLMEPNHHATTASNTNTVQFIVPPPSSSHDNHDTLDDLLPSSPIIAKRRSVDSDTQSVVTNFSISNSNSLSKILARLRGQKSDKEFWMPDEQCKECYKCRKPFTLLRRKHHCRTCGMLLVCVCVWINRLIHANCRSNLLWPMCIARHFWQAV